MAKTSQIRETRGAYVILLATQPTVACTRTRLGDVARALVQRCWADADGRPWASFPGAQAVWAELVLGLFLL